MSTQMEGAYGPDDDLVDYILGITFEIWEQRGVNLIHRYYGADAPVYAPTGIVRGAAAVVDGTRQVLAAYPDRLLLADDVIWSGNREDGYYSSHRIVSLMTNTGPTAFGPATGKSARILSIADCVVENGVITREWLMRDYYALGQQLGVDPASIARDVADGRSKDTLEWIANEIDRLKVYGVERFDQPLPSPAENIDGFARQLISCMWTRGDRQTVEAAYAPYSVLHRSADLVCSGRDSIAGHYRGLRAAIDVQGVSIDHIAVQPFGTSGLNVAVRWSVAGRHSGEFLGHPASRKPVYVLGSSHYRVVAGRIAVEWTVFDGLGVIAQIV